MSMSITVKKRKVMEVVTMGIRYNLFNEEELDKIAIVCKEMVDRVEGNIKED